MARQRDYIYRRKGSMNWWVRYQWPKDVEVPSHWGREFRESLGTSVRAEAEIKAMSLVHGFKVMIALIRSKQQGTFEMNDAGLKYEPGKEHFGPDGERIIATLDGKLIYMRDGSIERIESNPATVALKIDFTDAERAEMAAMAPKKPANPDDKILNTHLKERQINEADATDARKVWAQFKTLVNGKPLRDCDRDDALKLVAHLEGQTSPKTGKPLTTKTIQKKLSYLGAAVNHAIKVKIYKGSNPFIGLSPQGRASTDRIPLSERDMAVMREALTPGTEEHLLWTLLATTGMRVSEAFVEEEFEEEGHRFILTGSKTLSSRRRVPLPSSVCSILPAIDGPIFKNSAHNLGRNLVRVMRRVGITDERKVLHSLRHRAKDRLRIASCPLDLQYQILGHEDETVASGYGHGYPVRVLKEWVEKIGI